ncbi:MAG: hypothetical protein AAGI92_00925 [Pseudomonadota bacterium]
MSSDSKAILAERVGESPNSPHYNGAFDADDAAIFAGYEKPISYPFFPSDYPGYQHINTLDEGNSAIVDAKDVVTSVFKRKCDIG